MDRLYFGSKWRQWVLLATAACFGIFVWEALSDEPPAVEKSRLAIGLIDVANVYKDDRAFQQKMSEIKGRIEEFEKYVRNQQTEIARLAPKDSSEGSGEASDAAKRAAALQTALTAEIAAKRQAFLAEEAIVYYERYQM